MKITKAYLILHFNSRRIIYDLEKEDLEVDLDKDFGTPTRLISLDRSKPLFEYKGRLEQLTFNFIRSLKGKKDWNKFLEGLKI